MKSRSPQIRFILLCVALDMLAIGLAIPVLPELVGQLTGSAQSQAYIYGLLVAAFGLTQFLFAPLLGALSDRYGRRPVLLISVAGLGLDFLLTGLSTSVWALLLVRILGGATAANFIVAHSYAADVSSPAERAKNFGLIGAMAGLGFTLGPLMGGALGAVDVRLPFFVAAALCLLNAMYGWRVLPESLPANKRRAVNWKQAHPFATAMDVLARPGLRTYSVLFALSTFGAMVLQATWVLYGIHRFAWTPWHSGLSLLVVGVVASIVQGGLLGVLVARFGEARVVWAGFASSALGYAAYGATTHSVWLLVAVAVNFLSFAVAPALQALVSKAVNESEQGRVLGAYASLSSLIAVLAPMAGTPLLAQTTSLAANDWRVGAPFYLCAALMVIGCALAARGLRAQRGPTAATPAAVAGSR